MSKFITVPKTNGQMILINVDRMLYAYPVGEKETYVDCGGDDFVAVALSFEDISKLIYAAEDETAETVRYEAQTDEDGLFTGDAVFMDKEANDTFAVGKVYSFKGGYTTDDEGVSRPVFPLTEKKEIKMWFDAHFLPILY